MRDPRPWYREDAELFERSEVLGLSLHATLMFMILRARQWKRGAFGASTCELNRMTGGRFDVVEIQDLWEELQPLYTETPEGWVLAELEEQRREADAFAEKQAANGRLGGRPPKKPADNPPLSSGLGAVNPDQTQPKASDVDVEEDEEKEKKEHPPSPRKRGAIFDLDAALALHPALNTPAFRAAWADMTQSRHEAHVKALTPTGSAERLRKLAALGHDRAVAAIRHSIANGYQGVFEAGQNGHKAQQPFAVGRATPADWKALQPSDEQLRKQREELRRIDELWGNKRKAVAATAPGVAAESESA